MKMKQLLGLIETYDEYSDETKEVIGELAKGDRGDLSKVNTADESDFDEARSFVDEVSPFVDEGEVLAMRKALDDREDGDDLEDSDDDEESSVPKGADDEDDDDFLGADDDE